ncbi:hypothetical protein H4R19_004029, partial [Coemansia spiralis]
ITRREANAAIVPLLTFPEEDSGERAAFEELDRTNVPVVGRRQHLRKTVSSAALRFVDAGRQTRAKVEGKRKELSLKLRRKKSAM